MSIRIGINGFGRIGRMILRESLLRPDTEVVAINRRNPGLPGDMHSGMTAAYMAYMLKYDTVHGHLEADVDWDEDHLIINGRSIRLFPADQPADIPWGDVGAEYILEATGQFLTREKARPHIDNGARKVIFTGPSKDDTPMYVMGVNHETYTSDILFASNASCTTNCLAPIAKVLQDNFGIKSGLMTTIHAITATQKTVDGSSRKDWRGGRAAQGNIIPSSTGAAKAVGRVIPALAGKLTGISMRIPTLDVSAVDLVALLEKKADYSEVCAAMKEASLGTLKGILGYTDEAMVSSDFIGDRRTSIFDATAGLSLGDGLTKIIAWYDNEMGYSCKALDLAEHMHAVDHR